MTAAAANPDTPVLVFRSASGRTEVARRAEGFSVHVLHGSDRLTTDEARRLGAKLARYPDATPEPQQADASPVLDLVRQYGEECGLLAIISADPHKGEMERQQTKADALFARIAALVPQQPVQARGRRGSLWWIHPCGTAMSSPDTPGSAHNRIPPCDKPGPWLPLLVGGDPAPERTPPTHDDFKRLAGIKRDLHEPHVDGPREPSDQERADLELMTALGVDWLEDVLPAIERLKAEGEDWMRRFREQADRGDQAAQQILTLHRERNEARAELEGLKAWIAAPAPAQPDPLVLSLPEGTVDAVVKAARRWYYEHGYKPGYLPRNLLGSDRDLKLAVEQLAPPREPRTWPKLAEEPDLPRCVEVDGYGRWRRMTPTSTLYGSLDRDRLPTAPISIGQLRELGDVTEVTE